MLLNCNVNTNVHGVVWMGKKKHQMKDANTYIVWMKEHQAKDANRGVKEHKGCVEMFFMWSW